MHQIEASFRQKNEARLEQRRKARRRKTMLAVGVFAGVALTIGYYFTADQWSIRLYEDEVVAMLPEAEDLPDDASVYVPAIVDLPGDPMIISLGEGGGAVSKVRSVPKPADLVEPGVSEQIEILSDIMISASERFMTTIPSSQEDFAFFQTQRTASIAPASSAMSPSVPVGAVSDADQAKTLPDLEIEGEAGAGWGETIGEGEASLPEFRKTDIENTTSISFVIPEAERSQTSEDFFVKVLSRRALGDVVLQNGFGTEDARLADEAMKDHFGRDAVDPGFVVALRGLRAQRNAPPQLMQIALYANETYIGALARGESDVFVPGTDPWVFDDLFHYSGEPDMTSVKRQYRLLDAIYSTAARNQVPAGVIGEAIMYLSRGHDLNAFATADDRLVLVYSRSLRAETDSAGRVLFIAVRGKDKNLECYVYRQPGGDFACMSEDKYASAPALPGGMIAPVSGVMTSTFGPRKHPILNTVRVHKGVDWAGPVGTPVVAAFEGKVVFRGEAGEYGNLVRVEHSGGRETRYAHLDRFAESVGSGSHVKAGEVIGYLGSTGRSTGPHLHFELYEGGKVIDPLATVTVASDGKAVEVLTDRIIRVESAGNASAKNPLSSATGLGQFIDSTWLRMMRTYRPDLARSLSAAELLALRFNPTISREMVSNLAREGEAYLRARGHHITAGKLYLCHFLGMEGAHVVLSASADAGLASVLGQAVIAANPFLSGKNADWIVRWAENKMRSSGRRTEVAAAPRPAPVPPEFLSYKQALVQVMQQATETY